MKKRTFWGAFLFYFFIAFEFLYMASPFAVYFYSLYSPVLNFLNQNPALSWLIHFFMPHAVRETSSALLNAHNIIGAVLALVGFSGFLIGACQVYYHKLAKKGAVIGGIYNFIRHPQYASFILCSFGLLILWPRYLVLLMFITMLFVYYFLAQAEEQECEAKFGQSYVDYMNKTNRFLPFKMPFADKLPVLPKSKWRKAAALFGIYILVLAISMTVAAGINTLGIDSLYAVYTKDSATVSLSRMEPDKLDKILGITYANEEVLQRLQAVGLNENAKSLNYVLPLEWTAAEVPMNNYRYTEGHKSPSDYNKNLYKIIFTKATLLDNSTATGKKILTDTIQRLPLLEVWVDLSQETVVKILEIPEHIKYSNIPVALY